MRKDQVRLPAVRAQHGSAHPTRRVGRRHHDRAGAVAKETRGALVVGVEILEERVGPDHEHALRRTGLDLPARDGDACDEARASRAYIERPRAMSTELGATSGAASGVMWSLVVVATRTALSCSGLVIAITFRPLW
jgi:hypothetical protein